MFGTLYEPPSLTFSGFLLLFALQVAALVFYKQAKDYYRNAQLYHQYGISNLGKSTIQQAPPVAGPAGPANGAR